MGEQIYFENISIADEITPLYFGPVTTENLARWAAGSGDFNRIHYDQEYARTQGLQNVIVPGPMKSSLACRMLLRWCGKLGRILKVWSRYRSMDFPGDILTSQGRVINKFIKENLRCVECEFSVVNQKGNVSVEGTAIVVVPSKECCSQ